MGYFIVDYVVVDTGYGPEVAKINKFIHNLSKNQREWFTRSPEMVNGSQSFIMWYDGSKEGWDTSNNADNVREKFTSFLRKNKIHFIHVRRPEDECWRIENQDR